MLLVVLEVPPDAVFVLATLFEAVILLALSLLCFSASTDFVAVGRKLRGTLGLVGAEAGRAAGAVLATPVVAALAVVVVLLLETAFPVDNLLKVVGRVILVLVAVALSVVVAAGLGFDVTVVAGLSGDEAGLVVDVTLGLLGLVAGLVSALVSFVAEVRLTSPFVIGFFSIGLVVVVGFVVAGLLRFEESLLALVVAGLGAAFGVVALELVRAFGVVAAGFAALFKPVDVLFVGVGVVFALAVVALVVLDTRLSASFSKTKTHVFTCKLLF